MPAGSFQSLGLQAAECTRIRMWCGCVRDGRGTVCRETVVVGEMWASSMVSGRAEAMAERDTGWSAV